MPQTSHPSATMARVAGGKRAGERAKSEFPKFRPTLLLFAVGITFALVAWGYLVIAAIDFGASARHDDASNAWAFLGVASLGAMACLFLALMLAARFSRALGLTHAPEPRAPRAPAAPAGPAAPKGGKRSAGGKRAAR
jgi:hypothetical protein